MPASNSTNLNLSLQLEINKALDPPVTGRSICKIEPLLNNIGIIMNKNLTLLVGGVLIAGIATIYWNSRMTPMGHSMTPPDTTEISQGGAIADVRLPAKLSGTAKIGEVVFNAKCASCHGTNAAGKNGAAPPLIHKIYEPSHHGDAAFLYAARNGVQSHHWPFGNMPPVEGLTDADVKNIVIYIREVQRENGID